jgi:hypothetical protein
MISVCINPNTPICVYLCKYSSMVKN